MGKTIIDIKDDFNNISRSYHMEDVGPQVGELMEVVKHLIILLANRDGHTLGDGGYGEERIISKPTISD